MSESAGPSSKSKKVKASSSKSQSGSTSKKRKRPNGAFPSNSSKGRLNRADSTESLSDDPSSLGCLLSPEVKALLAKFKRCHARKDPFCTENQGIIDEFLRLTKSVQKQVLAGNLEHVNLAEAAVLLDCSMRTFSRQVQHTTKFVHNLAEFATSKTKPNENQEVQEENEPLESENTSGNNPSLESLPEVNSASCTNASNRDQESVVVSSEASQPSVEVNDNSSVGDTAEGETAGDLEPESNDDPPVNTDSTPVTRPEAELITILDDDPPPEPIPDSMDIMEAQVDDTGSVEPEVMVGSGEPEAVIGSAEPEAVIGSGEPETTQINEENSGQVESPKAMQTPGTPRAKRSIREFGDPPVLIPWYEQVIPLRDDDDTPPLLVSELRRKRILREKTIEEVAQKLAEKARRDSISKEKNSDSGTDPQVVTAQPATDTQAVTVPPVTEPPEEVPVEKEAYPVISTEGVVVKEEKLDDYHDDDGSIVPIGLTLPVEFQLSKNELNPDMGRFSAEEQAEIQKFINQLHYLPFTCELTKEEVKKTFQHAVDRLEQIYKEHNIPYSRHVAQVASNACAQISSNYAKWLDLEKSTLTTSSELHETFSQSRKMSADSSQGCSQADEDEELTIMERTVEKTKVQSDTRMKEMLLEIQKSIVPKYAQIPLIEENTEGFFRRVKEFGMRMKKVLEDEEKEEEFDVRKYEMDVLDVTNKESQELAMTDESRTSSPGVSLPSTQLGTVDNLFGFSFDGLPSPSSSDGGDGVKWVPLRQIFSHMKNLDRKEAARMFYAVLALLSFQNLDIKYDNHYSAESAALTSKNLDHSIDSKYPRGVKIMTSRCADVDKEEVYIAALSNKSRTETFRELEELHHKQDAEAAGQQFGPDHSHLNSLNLDEVTDGDSIHDISAMFVQQECPQYQGELFSAAVTARKRKRMSSNGRGSSSSSPSPSKPRKSQPK